MWLNNKFTDFAEEQKGQGKLTDFLELLQCADTETVFQPTRNFRQLSANNPYLKKQQEDEPGVNFEIEPPSIAKKLMVVREDLADAWVIECDRIAAVQKIVDDALLRSEEATEDLLKVPSPELLGLPRHEASSAKDSQLLRSAATRVAIRNMLHDMSLLPSKTPVHDWLSTFVLVEHARDLTKDGSVETLLHHLGTQPLHIRNGNLVDPLMIERELIEKTAEITDNMAEALKAASDQHTVVQSTLLERCFLQDEAEKED